MIISISNHKGGVGKTTTAINLAGAFAKKRKSVLLVDLDPQGNSTSSFLHREVVNDSAFDIFTNHQVTWDTTICETDVKNLKIIPAQINLAKFETALAGDFDAAFRIRSKIQEIEADYDVILIDTPPTLGLLTVSALIASRYVIIPIQSSYFALRGAKDLIATIEKVAGRANPQLEVMGIIVTLFDRRTILSKRILQEIRGMFGKQVFDTLISKSVRLEESPAHKQTILSYAPRSTGATEYLKLCREILKRIESEDRLGSNNSG